MLARMSERTEGNPNAKNGQGFLSAVRAEFVLLISLGTAAILIAMGNRPLEEPMKGRGGRVRSDGSSCSGGGTAEQERR